ncbi:MAG: TIGR04255 family protein [Phycisphaerales bacterium]
MAYKKPFLDRVIARLDLAEPLATVGESLPKDVLDEILQRYPILERTDLTKRSIEILKDELKDRQSAASMWLFYTRDRKRVFKLSDDFAILEWSDQPTLDDVRTATANLFEIILRLATTTAPAIPSRFGLRYINRLRMLDSNPLEWSQYIHNDLLSGLKIPTLNGEYSRVFSTCEVVHDDFMTRFLYGIHNSDYPGPIRQKEFILDYDSYSLGAFEQRQFVDLLNKCAKANCDLFEWSIRQPLRDMMNA